MNKFSLTLFILLFYINSYSEAMFAGNIMTVNPRSEVNALRNPAMMNRQKKDNFSIIYSYSHLLNSETESDVTISGVGMDSDYSLKEAYNGAAIFSGVWVSGKNAYGIGITKTGDGQMKFSSTEFTLPSDKITEEKQYLGSTFLFSYSYGLTGKQSLGIQIETSVSNEQIEKDMTAENKELESSATRISSGAAIGYYIHDNHFSFGAIFRPGMFGTEKLEYDLNNKTTSEKTHKSLSSDVVHYEGPLIIPGLGIRPSRRLMFAIEGGGIMPYTKKEKNCNDSLDKQTQKTELSYATIIKTGIDYSYSRYINIGFGGGYTKYSADFHTTDNVKSGTSEFSIIQITAGLNIKPSPYYHLLFGMDYSRITQNMKMDQAGINIKLDIVNNALNYTAGISCYY